MFPERRRLAGYLQCRQNQNIQISMTTFGETLQMTRLRKCGKYLLADLGRKANNEAWQIRPTKLQA